MSGGGRRTGAGAERGRPQRGGGRGARGREEQSAGAGRTERGGGDSRARGRGEQRPVAVLIGPPGAGKSTVGALLAALLGAEFAETDALVEEAAGKPVSDIFITDGEPAFRDLERTAVTQALDHYPGIVSL